MRSIKFILILSAIVGCYLLNHREHQQTLQRVEEAIASAKNNHKSYEYVYAMPLNETQCVFDVIGGNSDLATSAMTGNVSVKRMTGNQETTLPVDWAGITQHGSTSTNYTLFPGDRLVVASKN